MNDRQVRTIPLAALRAHPANSNVMPEAKLAKLREHIRATGHYPPLVVRPAPNEAHAYQVLDGHHRWRALEALGRDEADCVVWPVDDAAALTLLATLNRLEGADEPKRRAALVGQLHEALGGDRATLGRLLPESAKDLSKLLALRDPPPKPAAPPPLASARRAVHFFLLETDRRRLAGALAAIGGPAEHALMQLVETWEASRDESGPVD